MISAAATPAGQSPSWRSGTAERGQLTIVVKRLRTRKKTKRQRKLRFARSQVLHIHEIANSQGLDAAERAVAAFHPQLSPDARLEVVHRIADPGQYGGIETGTDPKLGDYADIAITKA